MRTREQFEEALDAGHVWLQMGNGNHWAVRRNGQTRTWKTMPDRFYISIKYGLKGYGSVTEHNLQSEEIVISETKPERGK